MCDISLDDKLEPTPTDQPTLIDNLPSIYPDVSKSAITVDGQKKVPDKGPVMLLYELFNDVNFECINIDGAQNNCRFKMTVTINEKKFDGTGEYLRLGKDSIYYMYIY